MSSRLRVTHVVLSMDVGGLERNVLNQVRQAARLGQDVSILCVEKPGALAHQAEESGAHVVCVRKAPGVKVQIIRRIAGVLRELRPHVVHTHQIGPLFYTGPAARIQRVPVLVHTEHGREDYERRVRTRWLGRIAGSYVHRFYCLTEDMASAVKNSHIVPPQRVRVIQNGIDIDAYCRNGDALAVRKSLGIPHDAPVIGTVGRLTEIKRQDVLIRAFADVRKIILDVHFLLVGDGPRLQELRQLADGLGLAQVVHFAGYQSHTAPFLHCMDVFALTSRSEGMPQAVLEAAVAGIPIIASRVGGLPEVIEDGHTGLLFSSGDQAALAASLLDLLRHRDRAMQMANAAKAHVESIFSIARMAAEYHLDFLQLLSRNSLDRAPTPQLEGVDKCVA